MFTLDPEQIQTLLEELCDHVYFQPPSDVQMEYPAIVYSRERAFTRFAGNLPYNRIKGYSVTVIDRDPKSNLLGKVEALPTSSFDRHYVADNLNHDVYTVFF